MTSAGLSGGNAGRRLVAERGLIPQAVAALTPMMDDVPFERLASVKGLLKRHFSDQPWSGTEADALADAVGGGSGQIRQPLDVDLVLVAGWEDDRFTVAIETDATPPDEAGAPRDLSASFHSGVVPEATPNPKTVRFATPRRDQSASRAFTRRTGGNDPQVGPLFASATEVVDVLVGPDFVAVSIARPAAWPLVLAPILDAVANAFGEAGDGAAGEAEVVDTSATPHRSGGPARDGGRTAVPRPSSQLDQAWAELGHLRPDDPGDLASIVEAAQHPEPARRQVAANLLGEAPLEAAVERWAVLLVDPSRSVRRATFDAIVDAAREPLRPLLERGLGDADAWVRWKAIHGLVRLGAQSSHAVLVPLAGDADFRVRLEAAAALRQR